MTGVSHAGDSRRQDVVHGFAVAILFDVDGGDVECTVDGGWCSGVGEALQIGAPIATHEIEGTEAEDGCLAKVGHVKAHEADAFVALYGAYTAQVFLDGHLELIPGDGCRVAVGQPDEGFAFVDDVVATHDHVFGADGDFVLIVSLIIAHGVVAVQVFYIGDGFGGDVVGLGRIF